MQVCMRASVLDFEQNWLQVARVVGRHFHGETRFCTFMREQANRNQTKVKFRAATAIGKAHESESSRVAELLS
jgi:hypothetical protein